MIIFARIAWPNTWKKKAESLEKLNCNLVSETARTADCRNSGEFMEAHTLYLGFKLPF